MSYNTNELRKQDFEHYLHPFSDMADIKEAGARIMVKGEGCHIWDSEGNKIVDGMSGLWCVNLGYGQKTLNDAASNQLNQLPFYNSFFKTSNVPAIELSKLLSEVSPEGFDRVFFTNSGSEGNDTIVRLVRHYWNVMGKPTKQTIISRWNGYHGSTMAGSSLSGMTYMHEQGGVISGVVHIDQPYQLQHGKPGESAEDFGQRAAGWLEDKIKEIGAENIGAFIGEPVQGAGGVIIPPPGYWTKIQEICRRYDILLVCDEVICGFGRLGTWFGCQHPHINVQPDLITIAKGLTNGYIPMGGVLVSKKVGDVIATKGGDFNHGFTYSGHPVAAAVGIATIKLIQSSDLINTLQTKTIPYFSKAFATLNDHPLVGDADSLGMVAGLVLYKDKSKKEHFPSNVNVGMICRDFCFRNGVVMRAVGNRMIMAPPLIVTEEVIDEMISKIRLSLDATWAVVNK